VDAGTPGTRDPNEDAAYGAGAGSAPAPSEAAGAAGTGAAGSPGTRAEAGTGTGTNSGDDARRDANGDANGAAGEGATVPTAGAASVDLAAELMNGPAVWIGELRSIEPILCAAGVPDHPLYPETLADSYLERAVLILERSATTGALRGAITFGDGTPPATPGDVPPLDDADWFWLCISQRPTDGFEYSVLDAQLSSGRLRFAIAPNELWQPWCESREFGCAHGPCEEFPSCHCGDTFCEEQFENQLVLCKRALQYSVCECEAGACWAELLERVYVDLVATEQGLEGIITLGNFAELRLMRAQ
jgi:hypothetical protein